MQRSFPLFFSAMAVGITALLAWYALRWTDDLYSWTGLFALVASFSYAVMYLVPLYLSYLVCKRFGESRWHGVVFSLVAWVILLLLINDLYIFELYGFHINGFVLNILMTPGGLESMGVPRSTFVSAGVISLVLLLSVAGSWLLGGWLSKLIRPRLVRYLSWVIVTLFLATTVIEKTSYGFAILDNNLAVLTTAQRYPLYVPMSFRTLAKSMGYKAHKQQRLTVKNHPGQLNYPLKPITYEAKKTLPNIVWLVAESWRWDMLDPRITPNTWQFAQENISFKQHYSTGNGTRMGLFGMFYGLPGSYWFNFLRERRSPVLIDAIQKLNYQTAFFTSAKFTYPEFDKTIFSAIAKEKLVSDTAGAGWQRDQRNVTRLLDFIGARKPDQPFMTFMFFESPHANYYFPPENVIEENYLDDFDYIATDIKKNIGLIKNRYINSCNHLDSQFSRVIDSLKKANLLDNTIVIVTGDHGEEFMEDGRWGHNSQYSNPQIRTPLIIHLPGAPAMAYTGMSSHVDIPAIVMQQLGVTNPPGDYSDGQLLLAGEAREQAIIAAWNTIGYVDADYKLTLPMSTAAMVEQKAWHTATDAQADAAQVYRLKIKKIGKLMPTLSLFIH